MSTTCYICAPEGVASSVRGLCAECNQFACGDPSGRTDKKFHAAQCGCSCRKLVCKLDMSRHSHGHGKTPSDCFPGYVLDAGATVLHAAQNAIDTETFDEVISAASDLLVAVEPGPEALRLAMDGWASAFLEEYAIGDRSSFTVSSAIMTPDTVMRFAALGARAIANVDLAYAVSERYLFPRTQQDSLTLIREKHRSRPQFSVLESSSDRISPSSIESLRRMLPQPEFIRSVDAAPLFESASDMLRWLLTADDVEMA